MARGDKLNCPSRTFAFSGDVDIFFYFVKAIGRKVNIPLVGIYS